jgi:hypothetical protein
LRLLCLKGNVSLLAGCGINGLLAFGELLVAGLELGALGEDNLAPGGLVQVLLGLLAGLNGGVVGVKAHLDRGHAYGVALLGQSHSLGGDGPDNGLDLIGVDDTGQVGVGHTGAGQVEAVLELGALLVRAEERVELLESALGPDAESSQVATGGEVEEVEVVNQGELNAGKVAEGLVEALGDVVDDKGAASHRLCFHGCCYFLAHL